MLIMTKYYQMLSLNYIYIFPNWVIFSDCVLSQGGTVTICFSGARIFQNTKLPSSFYVEYVLLLFFLKQSHVFGLTSELTM